MSGAQVAYFLEALKRHDPELVEKYEELYGGAYSPPDAEYVGEIALKVRDLCTKFGILDGMPRYIPEGPRATNKRIAEEIFSRCRQMEIERAPSYKVWAYRRAGWTIDELDSDILALYKRGGLQGLLALPNIGPSLASFIAEKLGKV
jgi:hypothetical protein